MTVPFMYGWYAHKYLYVPAVANVCFHVSFWLRLPLSKDLSVAVTVSGFVVLDEAHRLAGVDGRPCPGRTRSS